MENVTMSGVTDVADVITTDRGYPTTGETIHYDGDSNTNFSTVSNISDHTQNHGVTNVISVITDVSTQDYEYPATGEPNHYDEYGNTNFSSVSNASDYYYYDDYNDTLYYYDDEYYNDEDAYLLKVYEFELPALGIVRPLLIILTAMTNIFVVTYFMNRKKRENAANLLFVSIAFSDTLTGLLLLPNSFRVYTSRDDELSREWCDTYMILRLYFSRVFHTVSVWQTLFLGFQRYMCVCRPFVSSRVCTVRKTLVAITVMYVLAFVLHVYHLQEKKSIETGRMCTWQEEQPCEGMCVYLWACVLLQHLIPSLVLVVLTARTLRGIRGATRRLSTISKSSTSRRSARDRTITITSCVVVVVFLIPELPHGVYKLVLAISSHGGHESGMQRDTRVNHVILCIYELAFLVSFHANFWIYCSMMHKFRQSVMRLLTCTWRKETRRRHPRWRQGSTSSRKNSGSSLMHSRTGSMRARQRVLSQSSTLSNSSEAAHAPTCGISDKQLSPNEFKLGPIEKYVDENSSTSKAPAETTIFLSSKEDAEHTESETEQRKSLISSAKTDNGESCISLEALIKLIDKPSDGSNTPTETLMVPLVTNNEESTAHTTTLGKPDEEFITSGQAHMAMIATNDHVSSTPNKTLLTMLATTDDETNSKMQVLVTTDDARGKTPLEITTRANPDDIDGETGETITPIETQSKMLAGPEGETITSIGTPDDASDDTHMVTLTKNDDDFSTSMGTPIEMRIKFFNECGESNAPRDTKIATSADPDELHGESNTPTETPMTMAVCDNKETANIKLDTADASCSLAMAPASMKNGNVDISQFIVDGQDDAIENDDVFL